MSRIKVLMTKEGEDSQLVDTVDIAGWVANGYAVDGDSCKPYCDVCTWFGDSPGCALKDSTPDLIQAFQDNELRKFMILDYGKYAMETTQRLLLTFPIGTTVYDTDFQQYFTGDGFTQGGVNSLIKYGRVGTNSISGYIESTNQTGFWDRTYQTIMSVPTHVTQVRVIYRNLSPNPVVISSTGIASHTLIATKPVNPLLPVTFNGLPSITCAPRLRPDVASYNISDWMDLETLDRGADNELVYIRSYVPNQEVNDEVSMRANTSHPKGDWETGLNDANGVIIECGSDSGDSATNNAVSLTTNAFGTVAFDLQYRTSVEVKTPCAIGNSITNGDNLSDTKMLSPVHFACTSITTKAAPWQACNRGTSSQVTKSFLNRLSEAFKLDPDCIIYSSFSPNDLDGGNPDQDNIDAIEAMKPLVESAIIECRKIGMPLILSTGLPFAWSLAVDDARKDFNTWIKTLTGSGVYVVDYDLYLSDGASPAAIKVEYAEPGGLHPNEAGYRLMGETPLVDVLKVVFSAVV